MVKFLPIAAILSQVYSVNRYQLAAGWNLDTKMHFIHVAQSQYVFNDKENRFQSSGTNLESHRGPFAYKFQRETLIIWSSYRFSRSFLKDTEFLLNIKEPKFRLKTRTCNSVLAGKAQPQIAKYIVHTSFVFRIND